MPTKLEEHRDYYMESGYMVLTAAFLAQRGYCCGNGCRHCPYSPKHGGRNAVLELPSVHQQADKLSKDKA